MKYLKKISLSAAGTSLALASLGNILGAYSAHLKIVCGVISLLLFTLITLKIIIFWQDFKNDIQDINVISVFPTYFMTIMVLSTYLSISIIGINLSKVIWLFAFSVHIFLSLLFIKNYIKNFDMNKVLPNWFITLVAYSLVGIAAPMYELRLLGQIFVIIGLSSYFILFPVIFYKVLTMGSIPEKLKSTIWLFNSPINICIVAYMSAFTTINTILLITLLFFSLTSFILSVIKVDFKQLLKLEFAPLLSAFTFPTVIFITALKSIYNHFADKGWIASDFSVPFLIIEIIGVIIVFGILICNILHVLKADE